MLNIHPDDFDRSEGRKKIISFLHELEVKINSLEHTVQKLSGQETHLKEDIEDILRTEGEKG